jgi:hypothetical protein
MEAVGKIISPHDDTCLLTSHLPGSLRNISRNKTLIATGYSIFGYLCGMVMIRKGISDITLLIFDTLLSVLDRSKGIGEKRIADLPEFNDTVHLCKLRFILCPNGKYNF